MKTSDKLEYNFFPVTWGKVSVYFQGPSNCHIALSPENQEVKPITELILGGWENTQSVVRKNLDKANDKKVETKNLVSKNRFTNFQIYWKKGSIFVKQGDSTILEEKDSILFPVRYIGVRTAWGATGKWKLLFGDEKGTMNGVCVL